MKSLKFIIPFLALALILALTPACAAEEPEVTEEPVEEPTVVEEPEVTEVPPEAEPEEELPVEEPADVIEGFPELLWSVPHENRLHSVAVSPGGETVAVGEFKVTYVYLLANGSLVDVIAHEHSVEDLDFSPDGSILGAGQGYFGILLTNTADSTELMTLDHGHNSRLAFSPDGKHIATGDREGIVWLWQLDDGQQVAALEEPEIAEKAIQHRWVIDINYHPSGKLLAATHNDDTVYIWDLEEEHVVRTLQLDYEPFSFSPEGTIMAGAVREDGEYLVRLWTVDGAEQLADLAVPGEVQDIAFSPDGSLLAVASFGRPTVRDSHSATTIYDLSSEKQLYTLDQTFENSDYPGAVAFTPDGGHLAVAYNDGTLELWRLLGAELIVAPPVDIRKPPPLPSDVLFDTGSAELKQTADAVLSELAEDLFDALPEATITFIGHTDSRGEAGYNLQLSLDRATAVKDWFESWAQDNGVDGWSFLVDGRGDTELKVPDTDVEGTFLEQAGALNRRVEIEIEASS